MDPRGIASELLMETLSDDAKVLLGGYFGSLGIPGRSTLTFRMKEVRPTARAQKALDELVEAGAMGRQPLAGGGVEYTVLINCSDFGRWIRRNKNKGNWSATESVSAAQSSTQRAP